MIRTAITTISLAFTVAWFLWSQLHWKILNDRNIELEQRAQFFSTSCTEITKQNNQLTKTNKHYAQQIAIHRRNRPGRKKHFAELKKLVKERNLKFGIGGN
mgnify:CR=1 FL=1